MTTDAMPKYFVMSLCVHAFVFVILILNVNLSEPLPVIENTNKHDVMSVVVLGDVQDSKILPQPLIPDTSQPKISPKKVTEHISIKKDVIALKAREKNQEQIAKDLLADIEKQKKKQKQLRQKKTQSQFEKLLRIQAEKSLRQQLLNEDIKLKGTQTRQSQGEINKYKALILQTISEHWLVPIQSNKKLYCELMIRVAPSGMVLDVQVTKSSGDLALDYSARAAVLKSSPLPVPRDSKTFAAFRQFVLKVKPENVI